MTNLKRARKTAEKLAENYWIPPFEPAKLFLERKVKVKKEIAQIVLSALNEAVKETCEDMLRLLSSTDETVALHSEFTGKYRGI